MTLGGCQGDDDAGNRKIISALDALERMGVVAPGEKEREAKAAAEKAQMKAKSDQAKADFKAATAAKMAAEAGATAPPTGGVRLPNEQWNPTNLETRLRVFERAVRYAPRSAAAEASSGILVPGRS